MPDFDWRDTQTLPLADRFPDNSVGILAWRDLVDNLRPLSSAPPAQLHQALERFMQQAWSQLPPNFVPECRVFVSHRRVDVAIAERIAFVATQEGFGYWLDVHDPNLSFVSGSPIPAPIKDILTAAIIEMGLLNSSHVIAGMTPNTAGSKWIPYEFGRAKYRRLHSPYSASWLYPGMVESDFGEYIYLAEITRAEVDIRGWLNATWAAGRCSQTAPASWTRPQPNPLPTSP
jgi:hypothetical protein